MVQEKPSSIRRFLSYAVKPNRSNVYKRTIVLISGIRFTCKFVPRILKDKQNKFFFVFWNFGQCSLDFNKLVIKAKMHAKTLFFSCIKTQYDFLALRHLAVCTKTFFFKVFCILKVLTKTGYFNTGFCIFNDIKIQSDIDQKQHNKYARKL
jgi:hypothetical protein